MYNNIMKSFIILSKNISSARNGCSDNVCTLLASDSRHHGYESLASLYQHTTLYHYSGRKASLKIFYKPDYFIMKTIHVIIQLLISCIRSLAIFWLTPTHASTPFYMPFFRNHSVEDFGQ